MDQEAPGLAQEDRSAGAQASLAWPPLPRTQAHLHQLASSLPSAWSRPEAEVAVGAGDVLCTSRAKVAWVVLSRM